MIQISTEWLDYNRCRIVVEGHAGYAPIGSDIVCAGISALYETLKISLESLASARAEEQEPVLNILQVDERAEILIRSFLLGCQAISMTYPNHVKVNGPNQ